MLKENHVLEMMQLWKCKIFGVKALWSEGEVLWALSAVSAAIMEKGEIAVTCNRTVAGNFI
jgi:hypothetical protein